MIRILFFTRVDRTYLIQKISEYINSKNIKCELVVISDSLWNCCENHVKKYICIPPNVDKQDFVKEIIIKYNISGIFVASNYDLIHLIQMKQWLKEHQVRYYAPDERSLRICLSKVEQYYFLNENQFLTPKIYTLEEITSNKEEIIFPLILKPINGQGSRNIVEVSNLDEVKWYCKKEKDIIIQSKVYGKEYTVDCFNDFNGNLILCVPRERLVINGAHAIVAKINLNESIINMAIEMSRKLKIIGPWNFQLFEINEDFIIHDINPRIANGLIFSIESGAPFQELIVDNLLFDKKYALENLQSFVEDDKIIYQYTACFSSMIR